VVNQTADPALLLAALARTPVRIEAAATRLRAEQLPARPAEGAWSANEVLWHLRACADVYGEQVARIVEEDQPRWRHVSPRARMKRTRYDELPFADSFAAFQQQRIELVERLEQLPPQAWQRFAFVRTEKGEAPVSLLQRLSGMAQHEAVHCDQFEALV